MYGDESLQLDDLLRMLRRRAALMAVIAGAVTLLAVFVAATRPNQYESYATLLVEPQVISKSLLEAGITESDLNNRLHLMTMEIRSRLALSRLIDRFDLYPDLQGEMTREELIEHMNEHIRVEPILPELISDLVDRRTLQEFEVNTFKIFFRNESPQKAAAVANALAQNFIDKHLEERIELSGSTSEFIRSELEALTRRIRDVDNQISRVRAENVGSLPEDQASNQRMLERTMESYRAAQRELALAESDASFYRQQAKMGGGGGGPEGRPLTPDERLQMLENQLAEYRGRGFTDKHPDVIIAKEEIALLEQQLAGSGEEEDGKKPSPVQSTAQAEARRAELRAESARQELERLQAQIDSYEQRLARTPEVIEQLSSLERQREHLGEQYAEFSNKLQQASVAADMESRQKGERFRVLESAYPSTEVASPNRPLLIALGLILGLGLGVGVAVLVEASDHSYRESRGLQPAFGLPVLASIPKVVLESDRVALRRRRMRQAVAAAAVVTLVLGASVAGNWAVNGVPGAVQEALGMSAGDGSAG